MIRYKPNQFAKMISVSVSTLRRWDNEGVLKARRTQTNHRYYTDEDIQGYKEAKDSGKKKLTLVYCRVSSANQRDDLKSQQLAMEQFCLAKGLVVDEYLSEVGGGMNFKRLILLDIMNKIENEEVATLVIAHKDRLCRFGFEFFEHFAKEHGCNLVVVNQPSLSPQEEMVEDMLSIIDAFSNRLDGLRKHKKEIKEFING
jgi:hypothetical protein